MGSTGQTRTVSTKACQVFIHLKETPAIWEVWDQMPQIAGLPAGQPLSGRDTTRTATNLTVKTSRTSSFSMPPSPCQVDPEGYHTDSGKLRHGTCHFALDTQVFIKISNVYRNLKDQMKLDLCIC